MNAYLQSDAKELELEGCNRSRIAYQKNCVRIFDEIKMGVGSCVAGHDAEDGFHTATILVQCGNI